jgi:hypothetical protein
MDHFAPMVVTRRRLLQGGAGVLGVAAVGRFKHDDEGDDERELGRHREEPRPIPGGFSADFVQVPADPFIHVLDPSVGNEMSTITDFKGVVGAAHIQGKATGGGVTYDFDADMRFMKGRYISLEGHLREGAFAFV